MRAFHNILYEFLQIMPVYCVEKLFPDSPPVIYMLKLVNQMMNILFLQQVALFIMNFIYSFTHIKNSWSVSSDNACPRVGVLHQIF